MTESDRRMAINSKPTTSFYVNYGNLDPQAAQRALAPVFIAPRYRLHRVDGSDLTASGLGNYEDLTKSTVLSWPGRIEGSNDIVDLDPNKVSVLIRNAGVVVREAVETIAVEGYTNRVTVATDVVSGDANGFALAVGDVLYFKNGTRAEIFVITKGVDSATLQLDCDLSAVTDFSGVEVVSYRPFAGITKSLTSGYSISSEGITLSDALVLEEMTVKSGEMFVEYRELLTEDCMTLRTNLNSDSEAWAGVCDPDNPMGMLFAAASAVGGDAFFYMLSVAGESEDEHLRGLSYVAQFEDCYAPITYRQTHKTQMAIMDIIAKYSNPRIAQYKRSWFCVPEDLSDVIYPATNDLTLYGSITDGVLTLEDGADLYRAKVIDGDVVNVVISANDAGAVNTVEYSISDVLSKTTLKLSDASANAARSLITISRPTVGSSYAKKLAEIAASWNSERINFVVSDALSFAGFDNVNPVYACAALAAQRCALPPHAPMNDMQLPGFKLGNNNSWTDSDYEVMNAGGCWILYRDLEGRTLTYHQITTKTDGTIAEDDSVVSNGDSIVRTLRKAVVGLCGGKGNATQALLDEIKISLVVAFKQIDSEVYPAIYGPRIVDWNIANLYIPEGNKRAVMCDCDIETPQPTQDSRFNFNLF